MFGEARISGVFVHAPEFKIRTKMDAALFLQDIVCAGTHTVLRDLNRKGWHYVIFRPKEVSAAYIAHERDGKDVFEPDLMRSGQQAIDMVFRARRSINEQILRREE